MDIEQIQKFLDGTTSTPDSAVRITFKKRDTIQGLFIREHNDYTYLKSKNFWRIVPKSQLETYLQTRNNGLAKIFNGAEFAKLTLLKDSVEL